MSKSITLNNVTARRTNWLKIKLYFKNPELNDIVSHTVAVWPQTPGNGGRLFGELFFVYLHFNRESVHKTWRLWRRSCWLEQNTVHSVALHLTFCTYCFTWIYLESWVKTGKPSSAFHSFSSKRWATLGVPVVLQHLLRHLNTPKETPAMSPKTFRFRWDISLITQ